MSKDSLNIQPIAHGEGEVVDVSQVSTQDLAEAIKKINSELGVQRGEGKQMIQAVLLALVFIVVTVAAEVIYAHGIDVNRYDALTNKFAEQAVKIAILEQKQEMPLL